MTISITKPTVGGSENTWGTTINTALDDVVDVLNGDTASTPDLTAGSWKVGGTAVTADAADLNYAKDLRATGVTTAEFDKLDGLTASTSELNKMDGVTATTAELNYTDGVTSNIQTQLSAITSTTISAGSGLTGGGSLASNRTISHSDTSSQGSVNNSGNTVVQDISVDTYGHVTSIGSKTLSIPAAQSTSLGAVGTYTAAGIAYASGGSGTVNAGTTVSGSTLKWAGVSAGISQFNGSFLSDRCSSAGLTGTWRQMTPYERVSIGGYAIFALWVRIS